VESRGVIHLAAVHAPAVVRRLMLLHLTISSGHQYDFPQGIRAFPSVIDSGEVSRGERMLYSGADPESYITEYTLVYADDRLRVGPTQSRISSSIL